MAETSSYDWTRFVLRIEISATPDEVFRAWTEGDQLRRWFPTGAETEPKKGGRIYLQFLDPKDRGEFSFTEFRRPNLVSFTFGNRGEKVRVRIRKSGAGAVCELEQFDMKTTPKEKVQMHMGCKTGWVFFLTNLKAWLEHGIDLRSHDPKKSYRQSYVNS